MSEIRTELARGFSRFTTFVKDIAWWVGAAVVFVSSGALVKIAPSGNWYWTLPVSFFTVIVVLILAWSAYTYRRRWTSLVAALRWVHMLTHNLRTGLEQLPADASSLSDLLQGILDDASHAFRALTGARCTASILMPEWKGERRGMTLRTAMYCSDTDPERKRNSKPQEGGLAHLVLRADRAMVFNDYKKELKAGRFRRNRDDWENWYQSGMMAHFKVYSEPCGIFNVDAPQKNVFDESYRELLCAYADACALVLSMSERQNLEGAG